MTWSVFRRKYEWRKYQYDKCKCGNTKTKISNTCRRCYGEGPNNPQWKGDKVTRVPLHKWIKRHKPKPDVCEKCNKVPPFDLANISQEYKRDINDFEWLCRLCHMKSDGRVYNLINYRSP
ncbi:hypothetical protein LCGC14_2579420 [marine sediment metagenome]|uniref:Uncharacterized protein n=1 Tax=marine sediment metagenome TaxID=412755 RepID=A0A0F9D7K5_9ZZZZ